MTQTKAVYSSIMDYLINNPKDQADKAVILNFPQETNKFPMEHMEKDKK